MRVLLASVTLLWLCGWIAKLDSGSVRPRAETEPVYVPAGSGRLTPS